MPSERERNQDPAVAGEGVPAGGGPAEAVEAERIVGRIGELVQEAGAIEGDPAEGTGALAQADGAARSDAPPEREKPRPWRREPFDGLTLEDIARACHEANRALQLANGETPSPPWEQAPAWQRSSACDGLDAILAGRVTTPAGSHETWLAERRAAGWVWGPEKDEGQRMHPCLVPYEELPPAQRAKDGVFFAIVVALSDEVF